MAVAPLFLRRNALRLLRPTVLRLLSSFRLQADFNETADSFGAGDAVRGGPRLQVGHELIGKPEGP